MIWINEKMSVDDSEVTFEFIRSSGPGGQNVNKVETMVEGLWDIDKYLALTDEENHRIRDKLRNRIRLNG